MTSIPHDPYADPDVYDILTSPGTEAEVEGLLSMAAATRPAHRPWRWLEPACGTGRYLLHARAHGVDVWGFDASPEMIAYAAARLPPPLRPQLWVADLVSFADRLEPASIDFAFNLHSSLRHLPSDRAVLAHLQQMTVCLRPGGLYAVGLDVQDAVPTVTEDVWTAHRGDCRVMQMVQYLLRQGQRMESVVSHLVVERSGRTEHRDHVYELRTYRPDQWRTLVERAGWIITDVVDERGRSTASAPFAYGIHLLAPVSAGG